MLQSSRLKPWRVHHWLSPKVPRDEAFREIVLKLCELYERTPSKHERIVSLDELTSIQPRTRTAPTKPARPDLTPVRLEHDANGRSLLLRIVGMLIKLARSHS